MIYMPTTTHYTDTLIKYRRFSELVGVQSVMLCSVSGNNT